MLRFVLRILLLIMMLSTLLFTARVIGQTHPAPSLFAVIFTNPDGSPCEMPCMFGVRPGEMSRQQAIAILKKHPVTQDMKLVADESRTSTVFESDGISIGMGFNAEWIDITFTNSPSAALLRKYDGSLGRAIEVLGVPEQVRDEESLPDATPTRLIYPSRALGLGYQRSYPGYMLPDDMPRYIMVSAKLKALAADPYGLPWKGFGYAARYSGGSRNAP